MFLQNAKRKHVCGHCGNDIERGEIFCVQFVPREGNPKPWAAMYHFACWIPHMEKMLQKKYDNFAGKDICRPPMKGRPRIPTTDRPLRRKLLSLRAFHAKRGNVARVEEINRQIKALEVTNEVSGMQSENEQDSRTGQVS
jgi:hypothetical protein